MKRPRPIGPFAACSSCRGRPRHDGQAAFSQADAVCLDLEDSVTPAEKPASRAHVVRALRDLDFGGRVRLVSRERSRHVVRGIGIWSRLVEGAGANWTR